MVGEKSVFKNGLNVKKRADIDGNRRKDSVNLTDSYACGVFADNRHNADSGLRRGDDG